MGIYPIQKKKWLSTSSNGTEEQVMCKKKEQDGKAIMTAAVSFHIQPS